MKSLKILLLFLGSTIFLCNCKDEKEEENELFFYSPQMVLD